MLAKNGHYLNKFNICPKKCTIARLFVITEVSMVHVRSL